MSSFSRWTIIPLVVYLWWGWGIQSYAYVTRSIRTYHILSLPQQQGLYRPVTSLCSTSTNRNTNSAGDDDDDDDDDEISKLIGKRSQIKRKTKIDPEEAFAPTEPTVDLDLDKLPEFKTERPVRRAKQENDKKDKGEDDQTDNKENGTKGSSFSPIVDFMNDYEDENDFHIPNRIGVSTKAWGDPSRNFVPGGKLTKRMIKAGRFVPGDLQLTHTKLLENGIVFFDTASTYGSASRNQKLSAEDILQRCIAEQPEDVPETILSVGVGSSSWSKVLPKGPVAGIVQSLEGSLGRLNTDSVELFQISKALFFPSTLLANAMAEAIESGQCNYVGVQGATTAGSLRRLRRKLEAKDVSLTTNTFGYSLTNRKHEKMFDICKDQGVIPLVSDPLDGGLASGVYTATNPSGGQQGAASNKFTFKQLEKLQPLHSVQETVAERVSTRVRRETRDIQERFKSRYGPPPKINTEITTTQVALQYVIAKGGVPLPEVNTLAQAEEVLGCLGWTLNDEEVSMLDAAASLCSL